MEVYTSPSMFLLLAFLANTTGTLKCRAAMQAMAMPDASMVRILLIPCPANRRWNYPPLASSRAANSLPMFPRSPESVFL